MTTRPGERAGDYHLSVFGAGALEQEGAPILLRSHRTLAVAWYVGTTRSGVERAALSELFWPDAPTSVGRGNLRVVLSTLRSRAPGLLHTDGDRVRRGTAPLSFDTDEFERCCRRVVAGADLDERLRAAAQAARCIEAGVFTGADTIDSARFADWVETERNRVRMRFVDAVAVLGEALADSPRADDALDVARLAAEIDPYNELVQLLVAGGLAALGDLAGARRQLADARSVLHDDLGVDPRAEAVRFERSLRVRLPQVQQVVDRLDPLPPREELFGRDELIDRVEASITDGGRQVTLTGAGGVGKTAIATELAHRARGRGRDVIVVDLVGTDDPAVVDRVIVDRLGGRPLDRPDRQGLTERGPLLVLDNFEHVLAAAPVVTDLLRRWPVISIVVTSRVPLRIAGERVVVVPSLDVDARRGRSAAAEMFLERARAGGVNPDQLDRRAVDALCRTLDGLPLAIELAAAQCASAGLPAVVDLVRGALDVRDLSVLRTLDPQVAVRHRSLDAVLDGTLSLLPGQTLDVLAAAAAFDGPFTADALVAVAAGHIDAVSVRAGLTELVEASLMRVAGAGGTAAPTWYRLPPPVRAVAARLADDWDGRADAERARVDYDVAVARRARADLSGASAAGSVAVLERYLPSLRVTFDRLASAGDPRRFELLAGVLPYRWEMGDVATCASWLRSAELPAALPAALPDKPPDEPWRSVWAMAALWQKATDAEVLGLGRTAASIDDLVVQVRWLVDLLDETPVADGAGSAAIAGVHTLDASGRSHEALALVATARRIAAASPALLASLDYHEAKLLHGLGDDAAADVLLRRVVTGADRHGNRRCALEAGLLADLVGVTGTRGGRRETLVALLDEAAGMGDRRQAIWTLVSLGAVDVLDGRLPGAVGWFRQALAVARPFGHALGLGSCLIGGAAIALVLGDSELAEEFDGSLDGELPALNRALPRAYVDAYRVVHRDLEALRGRDSAMDAAWSRGRTLPRGRALDRLEGYLSGLAVKMGTGSGSGVDEAEIAALHSVSRGTGAASGRSYR